MYNNKKHKGVENGKKKKYNMDFKLRAVKLCLETDKPNAEIARDLGVPVNTFTLAEDYHQKYLLKHSALKHVLDKFYTRHADLIASTAAARLNGYAGLNGTKVQLSRELKSLGLNKEEKKVLKKLVNK